MKNLRAIAVISMLCFLLPVKNSFAQAEVVKNGDNYVFMHNKVGASDDTTRWNIPLFLKPVLILVKQNW
nr:hypothetical protein [uncultured Draconibacterium sp.]